MPCLRRLCQVGLLLVGLVGCRPARAPELEPLCNGDVGQGGVRAGLDRRGCYGYCPVYHVRVCGDGTVVYDGGAFVKAEGRKKRSLSADALARLLDQLGSLPDGPTPLDEPVGCGGGSRPYVWTMRDGHRRWVVTRAPDGTPTADIFEERTGVREWIGTQAERERLWPESR